MDRNYLELLLEVLRIAGVITDTQQASASKTLNTLLFDNHLRVDDAVTDARTVLGKPGYGDLLQALESAGVMTREQRLSVQAKANGRTGS